MLVYKINGKNIQILNKSLVIAITLHVYVLIASDERRVIAITIHPVNQHSYWAAYGQGGYKIISFEMYNFSFLKVDFEP